jgi:hypothetical protein
MRAPQGLTKIARNVTARDTWRSGYRAWFVDCSLAQAVDTLKGDLAWCAEGPGDRAARLSKRRIRDKWRLLLNRRIASRRLPRELDRQNRRDKGCRTAPVSADQDSDYFRAAVIGWRVRLKNFSR